ncbi:protein MMS22-like isoform X2 [Corticium candelabrum]|uniref:protein MMS22-like isoform X2 n=1 Tax=Corticium candelabrum TaxID=121492 RepID=UPI002E26EF60|nr:protein MMS22-like isoform X2 [Corticium candelabrum]
MSTTSSYLESGALERLVNGESPVNVARREPADDLFGSRFEPNALGTSTRQMFVLLRQKINDLTALSLPTTSNKSNVSLESAVRDGYRQCVVFMCYLQDYVFRKFQTPHCCSCSLMSHTDEAGILLQQLRVLIKHVGCLSLTPLSAVEAAGSVSFMEGYSAGTKSWVSRVLFQLKLDIHWGVIEALFRLQLGRVGRQLMEVSNEFNVTVTGQMSELVKELILIAAKWKNSAAKPSIDFPPKHIQDMWVRIVHLIQWNAKQEHTAPFWSVVSEILTATFLSNSSGAGRVSSESISFCWWLLTKLAPLFWYDIKGNHQQNQHATVDSNWVFVLDLIKISFQGDNAADEQPNEMRLREYLCCLYSFCNHWAPSVDAVSLLWDVFSKRLNDHFVVPGNAIQELGVPNSPTALLEHTKRLLNHDVMRTLNSFHCFLRVMNRIIVATGVSGWKQMKGRFYSKFHRRKLLELTEMGLANFNSLFLVLASIGDTQDVGKKMIEFTGLVTSGKSVDMAKCLAVLRGQFALLLLCGEKQQDLKGIGESVVSTFHVWLTFCLEQPLGSSKRSALWKVMICYVENVQCVVIASRQLTNSEHVLLDVDLASFLVQCEKNELCRLLNCFSSILSHFVQIAMLEIDKDRANLAHMNSQHRAVLWQRLYPFIKTKSKDIHLPIAVARCVADVAVGFLRLVCHDGHQLGQPGTTFEAVAQGFATSDAVHVWTAVPFIRQALGDEVISLQICSSECIQSEIIHTWLRCVLTSCQSSGDTVATAAHLSEMEDLTEVIMQLPEMKEIFGQLRIDHSTEVATLNNVEQSLHCFVISVGKLHCQLVESPAAKKLGLQMLSYLGDLPKYLDPVLANPTSPTNSVKLVYDFCGLLVKYCHQIIYKAGQTGCLLPRLLNRLLPCVGKKAIPPAVESCRRRSVCMVGEQYHLFTDTWCKLDLQFLEGLACLFPDGFAKRKFREIFSQYFAEYLKKSVDGGSLAVFEPFKELLTMPSLVLESGSFVNEVRQVAIEIIRDHFLSLPRPPKELRPVLQFVQQLFKTSGVDQIARDTKCLLPSVLGCLLACEQRSQDNMLEGMKSLLTDLLEMMLRAARRHREILSKQMLLTILTAFLLSNTKLSGALVFRPLCLIAHLDQELALELLGKTRQAVNEIELSRGTGTDISLRTALEEFSKIVQNT